MSKKHRMNPERKPLTMTQRIAYGVGGLAVFGGGLLYGSTIFADGVVRIAHSLDAPISVGAPIHEFAADIIPDTVVEAVDNLNWQGDAGAIELGAGSLALLAAEKSVSFMRRSLQAPAPEQTPPPAAAPPEEQ